MLKRAKQGTIHTRTKTQHQRWHYIAASMLVGLPYWESCFYRQLKLEMNFKEDPQPILVTMVYEEPSQKKKSLKKSLKIEVH